MCIGTVLNTMSLAWKIIKLVIIALVLWYLFSVLNDKWQILRPFLEILKLAFKGISKGFSMFGFTAG